MFRTNFETCEFSSGSERCRYPDKVQVVDQFEANDFAHGENGFPRSLISQIMHAESEELQNMLLKRLSDVKVSDENKGKSNEQIIRETLPRYVQSASSLRDFLGSIEGDGLEKAVDAYKAKLAEKAKESDSAPSDTEIVDNV